MSAAPGGDNLARYVAINPGNSSVAYVSSGIFGREAANSNLLGAVRGGVGILKRTDGGQMWQALDEGNGLTNLYIASLKMHPTNPNILLAGAGLIGDRSGTWRHRATAIADRLVEKSRSAGRAITAPIKRRTVKITRAEESAANSTTSLPRLLRRRRRRQPPTSGWRRQNRRPQWRQNRWDRGRFRPVITPGAVRPQHPPPQVPDRPLWQGARRRDLGTIHHSLHARSRKLTHSGRDRDWQVLAAMPRNPKNP